MHALLCRLGRHDWSISESRPGVWTLSGQVLEIEVAYRCCARCGRWQREIGQTGRFADHPDEKPWDREPDLGSHFSD